VNVTVYPCSETVEPCLSVGAGAVGLLVGSFANVAIHRWPRGQSVLRPSRSFCPACGASIHAHDNLPVLSWLFLRGRCRSCDGPIPVRYPLVELVVGVFFATAAWVWGAQWLLPAVLVLTWALVVATAIDLEHRIIPNRLTYRLPLVLLPLLVLAAGMDDSWPDLWRGLVAAVAVPGLLLLLSEGFRLVRGKTGMGMGDIKLLVSIGLVVGYLGGYELIVFAYGTLLAAILVVVVLLATGRARLASRIPFGPYLAAGAMLAILAGEPLGAWIERYLGFA
jgi:leader peptidase (prepilin peptidase) / N-methyltransferase